MGEMSPAMMTSPGAGISPDAAVLGGHFLMAFSHSFTPRWIDLSFAPAYENGQYFLN
jgi:hypothetical protein